ncbi:hypothetical protein GCM10007878_17980 [Marinospirillum insulare]|uniref:Solute-binding protein family 3/N-terminal domain-containing protein n=1 Tax=Marinospirillum insulare TaxID=217169 RepID=A0ABQ5ZW06_9GAMM|nr:hypothetical protein GCM10007878_17980 [Marinospirillum insulare]
MLLALPAWANPMHSESKLPMSQFNFQGYVPESKESRNKDEDPNLIRIHVDPDLYWVLNKVIDNYQLEHSSPFRIHQGKGDDHSNLLDDGYTFDLVISAEMDYVQSLYNSKAATQAQVLAIGRLGLWAPRETVRSTSVITLQTGAIGLMPEDSVYHRAALEVLERHELDKKVKKRLKTMTASQDLYAQIQENEIPMGFLPWNRLVQGGVSQRREVLKLKAEHHSALVHGIALTNAGNAREEVKDFWRYIHGAKGKAVFKAAGFD